MTTENQPAMTRTREERTRRRRLVAVWIGFGMGLFSLATGLNRPTIANMRTLDLVHLLATGACLGVGLVALVLFLRDRRKG
jgi:hypothetical protein